MNVNKFLMGGLFTLSLCGSVFAGPSCDINQAKNPDACSGKVSAVPTKNNVQFTLFNVLPGKTYSCQININDDNPQQVVAQHFSSSQGTSITQPPRSNSTIPFTATNTADSSGLVQFTMDNQRHSVWKNESNTVDVVCNTTTSSW